jgi:formylmethanofuran dehydrogenase subunit D
MPVLTYSPGIIEELELHDGDNVRVNFENGDIVNLGNQKAGKLNKFYDAQMAIYKNGGLL